LIANVYCLNFLDVILFQFTQSYTDKRNRLSSTQGEKPVNLLPSHFFKIDDIPRAEKEFCVYQAEDVSNSIVTHKLNTCDMFLSNTHYKLSIFSLTTGV